MNDEEKKAIERIDYIQDFIIENGQYNADVNNMQYFSKVLNVIKKQSKEIEELIQRNKDLEQIEKEHKEENGRLRNRIKELQKELEEKDMQHELELIGKEEFTKANMAEIIKHYYTANEDCIPISKVEKELIQLNKDEKKERKGMKGQNKYFLKQQYAAKREILEKVLKMKGR